MKTKIPAVAIALGMVCSAALASQKSTPSANPIFKKQPVGMSTAIYRAFRNLSSDDRKVAYHLLHGAFGSIQANRSSLERSQGRKLSDQVVNKLAALGLIKKKGDTFEITDTGSDYHLWQSAMETLESVDSLVGATRDPNVKDADQLLAKIVELHQEEAKALPNAGRQDLWVPYQRIYQAIDHSEMDPTDSILHLGTRGLILMVNSGEKIQPSYIAEPYLSLRNAM